MQCNIVYYSFKKSSHLNLYSAFNNINFDKAAFTDCLALQQLWDKVNVQLKLVLINSLPLQRLLVINLC